ncbi:MAG TPA: hypothetical protein VH092_39065, partial [Urbifossiella sp.]|nr:hypothetical protein [Urbifossiella sp.]
MRPGQLEFQHNFYTRIGRMWAFLPPGIKGTLLLGQVAVEELLIWFTTPVEVLCRRRFGTRALSLLVVIQLSAVAFLIMHMRGLGSPLLIIFAVATAVASVHHFREARAWERSGKPYRHSYSPGDPLPFWELL